jgi:exodeoxyribonuclease V beta subunit
MMQTPTPFDVHADLPFGMTLLEASAGTGKTHAMTTLWLRLTLELGLDPATVAVITFTRAASEELRDRLRGRLEALLDAFRGEAPGGGDAELLAHLRRAGHTDAAMAARLEAAAASLDEAPIATIHGFCHRILQQHMLETGVTDGQHVTTADGLAREIAEDFWALAATQLPARLFDTLLTSRFDLEACTRAVRMILQRPDLDLTTFEDGREILLASPLRPGPVDRDAFARAETRSDVARLLAAFTVRARASQQGFVEADDAIARLATLLATPTVGPSMVSSLRALFGAVLIDEFQDTDARQWQILSTLFITEAHRLLAIGDPKQAIYAFRNADVGTYLDAVRSADRYYTLDTNYRSDGDLVRGLGALFGREAGRQAFAAQGLRFSPPRPHRPPSALTPPRPPLRVAFLPRAQTAPQERWDRVDADVARAVAEDIAALLFGPAPAAIATTDGAAPRPPAPSDVAVLVRRHSQADRVRAALRALGIPASAGGRGRIFESEEAVELLRVLKAVHAPRYLPWLRGALVTRLFGLTAHAVASREAEDGRLLAETAESFRDLLQLWTVRGFLAMFRRLLRDAPPLPRDVIGRFERLGELLHDAARDGALGPPQLVETLERWISTPATRPPHRERDRDEGGAGVTVLTIHSAKGLEFPFVWVPFSSQPSFPSASSSKEPQLVSGEGEPPRLRIPPAALGLDDWADGFGAPLPGPPPGGPPPADATYAEDLRLLYVACTRARHLCTVVATSRGQNWHAAPLAGLLFGDPAPATVWDRERQRDALRHLVTAPPTTLLGALRAALPEGLVEVVDLSAERPAAAVPRAAADAPSAAPHAPPPMRAWRRATPLDVHWRRTSFSGIVRDFDTTHPAAPTTWSAEHAADDEGAPPDHHVAPDAGLLPLPGSALLGNAIHRVLEHADFPDATADALVPACEDALRGHALDPKDAPLVAAKLEAVLKTPLPTIAEDATLADLPHSARLSELDFIFPLVGATGDHRGQAVTGRALAEALSPHAPPDLAPWLASLARQPLEPLRGFLSGSIDVIFRHPKDGRLHVADWKTNRLGPTVAHYRAASLQSAMDHHHYHLQYHLYLVALFRFMRSRVPGWDAERDFGGVFYFFLRGMDPSHPPGTGIFHCRPPVAAIDALDRVLGGPC